MLVEEWSTDSFQNLLFSLIVYCQRVGRVLGSRPGDERMKEAYPKKLVIVSHEFKRRRFMDLHVPALKFPREGVEFVGIDPPWEGERRQSMIRGEDERGYTAWERDPYGVGELLHGKRDERGWDEAEFRKKVLGREAWEAYGERAKEVTEQLLELVSWKGGEDGKRIFDKRLPWEGEDEVA